LALWPSYVPPDTVVELNSPVLLFSTVAVVLAALAFGVSPALRLSRPRGGSLLVENPRSTISHLQGRYRYPALITGQVALTMVLLAGAGAAMRTFLQLYHVELGYSPRNVLRLTLVVPKGRYTTWAERERFSDRVRAQISETADVESVTVGQVPPVAGGRNRVAFADRSPADDQFSFVQRVSHQYCSTLKIPIVRGRMWSEDDDARAAHLVVINQAMARRFWPGTDPIGQRIRLPDFTSAASWALPVQETTGWLEIVGVVGDTPNLGLRDPALPSMYIPNSLLFTAYEYLVIRTHGDPSRMLPTIRNRLRIIDTSAVLASIGGVADGSTTGEDVLRDVGWGRERLMASLFVIFSSLALTLAAIGLYGVVSYVVTHRQRDLAIRIALGAPRVRIVETVLASSIMAVAIGLTAGLLLSLATGRILAQWTGVAKPDLLVLMPAAVVLLVVAALAAWVPVRRAATGDPMVALRCS
jgi:putative ABC transport system permease protein